MDGIPPDVFFVFKDLFIVQHLWVQWCFCYFCPMFFFVFHWLIIAEKSRGPRCISRYGCGQVAGWPLVPDGNMKRCMSKLGTCKICLVLLEMTDLGRQPLNFRMASSFFEIRGPSLEMTCKWVFPWICTFIPCTVYTFDCACVYCIIYWNSKHLIWGIPSLIMWRKHDLLPPII